MADRSRSRVPAKKTYPEDPRTPAKKTYPEDPQDVDNLPDTVPGSFEDDERASYADVDDVTEPSSERCVAVSIEHASIGQDDVRCQKVAGHADAHAFGPEEPEVV